MRVVAKADVIVTTPEKWDGISRSWQTRNYVKSVSLLIIDEIHLLGICIVVVYSLPNILVKVKLDCKSKKQKNYLVFFVLGEDRGPVLEVIVSRTNFISSHTDRPVRVVGLSTAVANARDLADWLGITQVSC